MTNKPFVVWEFFVKNDDSMDCKLCPERSDRGKLKGTLAMQKDHSVTVSKVYAEIKKLSKHCDKFRNEAPDAWALAKGIKAELVKRFGVYIDPKMAFLVDMDSDVISRLLLDRIGNDDVQEVVSDTESFEAGDDDAYEEIMRKMPRMQKRASSQQQQNSELGPNGDEVQKYLDAVLYADFGSTDPLEWWRSEGMAKYPRLYELAMKYLPAPATSASIERSFSQAGLALGGRKG
ncbi:zinc finger BED domain-containing protein 1-like protein, partial [Aphelenchoides avenae]